MEKKPRCNRARKRENRKKVRGGQNLLGGRKNRKEGRENRSRHADRDRTKRAIDRGPNTRRSGLKERVELRSTARVEGEPYTVWVGEGRN